MFRRLSLLTVALALVITGCGSDAATTTTGSTAAPASAFPLAVEGVEIPAAPQRIVSASATHTEILFAVGAGDDVVATDLFSNHPPEAEQTPKVDSFNLNVEQIAGFDPDLVILAFDPGGAVDALGALGIPTLLFDAPAGLDDVFTQIRTLGRATGHQAGAEALIEEMQTEIEEIVAGVPDDLDATYYHELDPQLYTITSSTFIGGLYGLLGLRNVADPADADGFGYPQLSGEFLLDADPDFVFLADTLCCGQDAGTVAQRPGWASMSAVAVGRVVELDDDVASRWGPRVVDLLRTIAEAVAEHAG